MRGREIDSGTQALTKWAINLAHIAVDSLLVLALIEKSKVVSLGYIVSWLMFSVGMILVWRTKGLLERREIGVSYNTVYGVLVFSELVLILLFLGTRGALFHYVLGSFFIGYFVNPFAFSTLLNRFRFFV